MAQALYRKWRPLLWDEVVSQEHIIQTLKNAVVTNRVAHAYLFSGPRGTGKTTAARLLAKAVNCLNPDLAKRPCNECTHCLAVNENRYMDLIEIDAASNTSVDDVRDLRDKINFAPSQGDFKVYIVDEVHMLSTAAFNALLKTLEEPPPHVIFILATTEIHKIPATVLSRCQRHEFRRVPINEITRHLNEICKTEGIKADPEALSVIARQASGGMRDAISLLDQLASTGEKITLELAQTVLGTATNQSVVGLIQAVIEHHPGSGLDEIHRALDGGADARALARQVVDYLRNIMLIQLGNGGQVEVPNDVRSQMTRHASALPTVDVLRMMRLFNAAATDQRGGWSPSLGLELAFAEMLETPAQAEVQAHPRSGSSSVAAPHVEHRQAQTTVVQKPAPVKPPEQQLEKRPEQQPESQAGGNTITLEQVSKAWKQVSHLVKAKDTNLSALLNSGRLLEIREGVLILSFASDILQEKFNRAENMELTRKAIQEALGIDLPIQTVVSGNKNSLPNHVKPDGMVAAASQLGGEIVDIQ
ncbi:MAG TPA: DNA polymerase III subunit gamma/tau [Anaerolineales bacterium]|jgi:DNA polymerase-3 subunit gamma/tau